MSTAIFQTHKTVSKLSTTISTKVREGEDPGRTALVKVLCQAGTIDSNLQMLPVSHSVCRSAGPEKKQQNTQQHRQESLPPFVSTSAVHCIITPGPLCLGLAGLHLQLGLGLSRMPG
eukprot:scpid83672/ scgid30573/ 